MTFEILYQAAKKGELILLEGGFCHYHLRRDQCLVIHEILSLKRGTGSKMLGMLKKIPATCIETKCPADLESNHWYAKKGFQLVEKTKTKTGRVMNTWRLLREDLRARQG